MSTQYTYVPEKGKMFDFFAVLNLSTRFERIEEYFSEIGTSERISQAYARVLELIRSNYYGVRLFWEPVNKEASFFCEKFGYIIINSDSIYDVIDAFKSYDCNEMIIRLLSFYDTENNFSDNFYKRLVENDDLLYEFVNSLNINAEVKVVMLDFIKHPQRFIDRVLKLYDMVIDEIDKEYEFNKEFIENYYKEVGSELDEKFKDTSKTVDRVFKDILDKYDYKIIQFAVTLFTPYSIQYLYNTEKLIVYIGYEYEKMWDYYYRLEEDTIGIFKAFSDETRVQILDLVSKRTLSAGDISRELGVSPSSLSHHLDVLSYGNIVDRAAKGKRSMFSINRNAILQAINQLKKLINSD